MTTDEQPPRRPRIAFEDVRRAVMSHLREMGFRTTGGVARLLGDGNCGVIEFRKSSGMRPATLFTVEVGIVLGPLLPVPPVKPLAHCSDRECHVHTNIGKLADPGAEVWWTLPVDQPDPAILQDVLARVERDAVPFVRRSIGPGGLASLWESGRIRGITDQQRNTCLRLLAEARGPDGATAP